MKVIGVDNFDRESVSDVLICENVSEYYGKIIVEHLNQKLCNHSNAPTYYKLVPNDHKLYKFEP